MPNTIRYYLTKSSKTEGSVDGLQKIIDYLLTFVGEVEVKKESQNSATIIYTDTTITASLTMDPTPQMSDAVISNQITLVCASNDSVSVNLIKNVTKNLGFRIFNTQTNSYLLEDPNILDLTNIKLDSKISKVLERYRLSPLFQYREALVFFAKDKKDRIYLVNRHLLEYLIQNPNSELFSKEFGIVVAKDIGRFVALMDRGLIPISFHKYANGNQKIVNVNGLNIDKVDKEVFASLVYFIFDVISQSFLQTEIPGLSAKINVKKGSSLIKAVEKELKKSKIKNYLSIKIAQDVSYQYTKNKLTPVLSVSVYLDS